MAAFRSGEGGAIRSALLGAIPIGLAVAFAALVALPFTTRRAAVLLSENHLVENLTFSAFALASIWMSVRALVALRAGVSRTLFYGSALVALGMLVMAMEEVSWTQWFLGFETPEVVREVNMQKEFNLHNLPVIQDLNEWFLLAAGAFGFAWSLRRPRGPLVVPPELRPGLLTVTVIAGLELLTLQLPFGPPWDETITRLVEVAELILGLCAWAWAWLAGLWPAGGPGKAA